MVTVLLLTGEGLQVAPLSRDLLVQLIVGLKAKHSLNKFGPSQWWRWINTGKGKDKLHPCTGTKALYRPYGP